MRDSNGRGVTKKKEGRRVSEKWRRRSINNRGGGKERRGATPGDAPELDKNVAASVASLEKHAREGTKGKEGGKGGHGFLPRQEMKNPNRKGISLLGRNDADAFTGKKTA